MGNLSNMKMIGIDTVTIDGVEYTIEEAIKEMFGEESIDCDALNASIKEYVGMNADKMFAEFMSTKEEYLAKVPDIFGTIRSQMKEIAEQKGWDSPLVLYLRETLQRGEKLIALCKDVVTKEGFLDACQESLDFMMYTNVEGRKLIHANVVA